MMETSNLVTVEASGKVSLSDIEQFLYHEASLLDHNRLKEWFALFTTDATYWIPLEANQTDPLGTCSIIYDDHRLLDIRVRQASHTWAHARNPLARTCHQVTNVMLFPGTESTPELRVCSNLVLVEYRAERQRMFAGMCEHRLRQTDSGLKIASKRIDIINSEAELDGIAVLF